MNHLYLKEYIGVLVKEALEDNGVPLYHYAASDKPELILDPKRFGESGFSKREMMTSNVPRVFFYVDPNEREDYVAQGRNLYTTSVPKSEIYNLNQDIKHLKELYKSKYTDYVDVDAILKHLKKESIKGVFYSTPQFKVVAWFEPIKVHKVD